MSQFSTTTFLNLGKAFKNYAIANIISIGIGFITAIIAQITVLTPLMNDPSMIDTEEMVFTMIPLIAVFGIISLGIGIFVLVRYFQYISALKHAGEDASDPNLTRAYRMELWGLILTIALPVILVLALSAIIPNLLNFVYTEYDPYSPIEDMLYAILAPLILIYLLIILGALIIVIVQIVAKFAIDSWASEIVNMYSGNPYAINLHEGTTLMKWGVVAQICFSTIGSIIYIIGLFRAGNNAILLFGTPPSVTPTGRGQQTYPSYGAGPGFQSYYPSNISGPTVRPSTGTVGAPICPACGIILPDSNARFCPNCGRAL